MGQGVMPESQCLLLGRAETAMATKGLGTCLLRQSIEGVADAGPSIWPSAQGTGVPVDNACSREWLWALMPSMAALLCTSLEDCTGPQLAVDV